MVGENKNSIQCRPTYETEISFISACFFQTVGHVVNKMWTFEMSIVADMLEFYTRLC